MEANVDRQADFVDECIHPVLVPVRRLKGMAGQKSIALSRSEPHNRIPGSEMKTNITRITCCAAISLVILGLTAAEKAPEVPYPASYRSWRHVKSVVATESGKIFHFYANQPAVEGYRFGKFPNGSILVRETLRTVAGEGESKGMLKEGEFTALDVMVKDDQRYRDTAGWGFETFDGKAIGTTKGDQSQCYTCHSKQKDHDLVFSTLSETATAGTPYPEGYRHWTFLHSSLVPATFGSFAKKPCEKPCTAGIFHFYANDKAMQGLLTGSYPDGSIFAEEMLEWLGSKEGQRRVVGVMVKDDQRYASTQGWGYGNFDEGSRTDMLDAKARQDCAQCHLARKDKGYVFTEYRER
jgi:hypothetical protein